MDTFDCYESISVSEAGRRIKRPKNDKRKKEKLIRYVDKDPSLIKFKRPCNHDGKSFLCNRIQRQDIKRIKRKIYETSDKIEQEIKLCHVCSVNRRRSDKKNPKKRDVTINYYLRNKNYKIPLRMCQIFFTVALGISKRRLDKLANIIHEGRVPKECRGGDRVSHKATDKKDKVREVIGKLKGRESHYNRSKSQRIYLSSNLSIAKLRKMHNAQCEENYKVSQTMFSKIFKNEYNLGFSSPASDCCFLCTRLKHKIKNEKDESNRKDAILQYRIHKKRASAFYKLTQETPPDSLIFCFDLQQVQPLPKTPISDAFSSHEISFYIFCCVDMRSRNPTFFTWSEDMAGRGSVQIGSAVMSHLNALDLKGIKMIRLFCDGCGGQNKNSHITHALYYWLKKRSPADLNEVRITYPVRGHSFLPADRVFGRVEKLYSEFGTVKELGKHWELYDIKSLEVNLKKIVGISDYKRIYLKKFGKNQAAKVQCFQNFRFDSLTETPQNILKRSKTDDNIMLNIKQLCNCIPEKKKLSLRHLMEQEFGKDWTNDETLDWYKKLLYPKNENDETNNFEAHDDINTVVDIADNDTCDCLEDDHGIHI